jgi:hypothetical protein
LVQIPFAQLRWLAFPIEKLSALLPLDGAMITKKTWMALAAAVCLVAGKAVAEEALEISHVADGAGDGHVHPAACVTKSGAVLVAHFAEKAGHIFLARSTDGGRTWSDAGEVADIGGGQPYPGALTTLSDGRVLLTWNYWVDPKNIKTSGRRPWFATSTDEGRAWSAPHKLPLDDAPDAYVRHPILEMSPREWIFPMGDRVIRYDLVADAVTPFDDQKLANGPLVRTKSGAFLHATGQRSTDGGKTWTTIKPFAPAASYHNDMQVLDNGWIVTAFLPENRTVRLLVSFDDGLTWSFRHPWVIYDPGHRIGRACPQIVQLDKEHMGIVFWDAFWDEDKPISRKAEVKFARIRIDELGRRAKGEGAETVKAK